MEHNLNLQFPDPTMHARKGSGNISADPWFCKRSNHMIIFVFAHMQSHIGVQDQENAPICPLNLSLLREGFKNQIAERKANKISHLSNNETEW